MRPRLQSVVASAAACVVGLGVWAGVAVAETGVDPVVQLLTLQEAVADREAELQTLEATAAELAEEVAAASAEETDARDRLAEATWQAYLGLGTGRHAGSEWLASFKEAAVAELRATEAREALATAEDERARTGAVIDVLTAELAYYTEAATDYLAAQAAEWQTWEAARQQVAQNTPSSPTVGEGGPWDGRGTEQWRPLVERYFPQERREEAMSVMWCESRGNPQAKHPTSGATGLFQFLETTWEWVSVEAGVGGVDRTNPEANVRAAAWLVAYSERTNHPRGAWGHWECQP